MAEVPSHMRGAEVETERNNPAVRSKFDKSHGKGLPAPHLSHPGAVVKETGSKHSGFNENGHMLPKHVAYNGLDKHSEKSRAGMGGGTDHRNAGKQVYGGERVSRGSAKSGPGVLHANKRGSGPNLK